MYTANVLKSYLIYRRSILNTIRSLLSFWLDCCSVFVRCLFEKWNKMKLTVFHQINVDKIA